MTRFKRYAYRHLLPITFLFVLTGCYEIPPEQPQPFSCARLGEAYWEAFRLGVDSPDDVIATVVRVWSMEKENIQIEDGHDLWIDWSDSIETGLGAQYSALFREERRLIRIAMHWNQEDSLPSIAQVTCPPRTGPVNMLVLGRRKGGEMAKKRHTPEQVINKLREAEVAIAEGSTVAEAARRIGVTEQTFYRWRSEYGGLRLDQARRLKRLELENSRLKRAVADLTLDNQILREASEGNF